MIQTTGCPGRPCGGRNLRDPRIGLPSIPSGGPRRCSTHAVRPPVTERMALEAGTDPKGPTPVTEIRTSPMRSSTHSRAARTSPTAGSRPCCIVARARQAAAARGRGRRRQDRAREGRGRRARRAPDPAAVLRGHRRRARALRLGYARQMLYIRTLEAAGHAARQPDVLHDLFGREFLERRPLLDAIEQRRPGAAGAADRRDRPRRRRVRGVPARAALRLPGHDPRDRHDPRGRAAGRDPHLEPHARAPRGAASAAASTTGSGTRRSTARSRSCGRACPACPSGWPRRRPRVRRASCARSIWRRSPGVAETIDWTQALVALGQEELEARHRRRDARHGAEVPRGPRAGARRGTRTSSSPGAATRPTAMSLERGATRRPQARHVRPDPARGRRSRSARAGCRTRCARSMRSTCGARRGLLRRCAARWSRSRDDLDAFDARVRGVLGARARATTSTRGRSTSELVDTKARRPTDAPAHAHAATRPTRTAATRRRRSWRRGLRPASCLRELTSPRCSADELREARGLMERVARARCRMRRRAALEPPTTAAARPAAHDARRDAHRGRADRARVAPAPKLVPRALRVPRRRVGLDGALRARADHVPAGGGARRRPGRGVHVRHAAHAPDAVPRRPRPRPRARARRDGGARLGRRHPHRRDLNAFNDICGRARDDARRDRRDRVRRLGAGRHHAPLAARWHACTAGRAPSSGSTR